MPTQKKIDIVSNLREKLTTAKSVVFVDYRGLKTNQLENLRAQVERYGGRFMITKNTLLQLALQNSQIALTEPTAILFAFEDEIAPIKALVEFTKEWELPTIKAGFLGQEFITAEKVKGLAKLPGRDILLAMTIAQIQAPTRGLINALANNLRNLTCVIQSIKEQKENIGGD